MARRVVIIAVATLSSSDTPLRLTYLAICNILFLFLHMAFTPFHTPRSNHTETVLLVSLSILSVVLITAPAPLDLAYELCLSALCLGIVAFLLINVIVGKVTRFRQSKQTKYVTPVEDKLAVTAESKPDGRSDSDLRTLQVVSPVVPSNDSLAPSMDHVSPSSKPEEIELMTMMRPSPEATTPVSPFIPTREDSPPPQSSELQNQAPLLSSAEQAIVAPEPERPASWLVPPSTTETGEVT
jgi:hypothetical protein